MFRRSSSEAWGFGSRRASRLSRPIMVLACLYACIACSTDRSSSLEESKPASGELTGRVADSSEREEAAANEGWIGRLQGAHAKADLAESKAQQLAARSELERLLDTAPDDQRPGSVWLRQDLLARLAALDLALGEPRRAVERAEQGLAVSTQTSLPASNLLMVQGKALEQLGDKTQAVKTYHRALVMNEELMKRSLEGR